MRRSTFTSVRRFLLGIAITATPAFANVDGTLDTRLDPPTTSHNTGAPGVFRFSWDLGGALPNTNVDTSSAIGVQPDGKFLVAGYSWNTFAGQDQYACALARYGAEGLLDPSFGSGGMIVNNFFNAQTGVDCYPLFVTLLGDGHIVWGGSLYTNVEFAWLGRMDANGTIDVTFGGSGNGFYIGGANTATASLVVDTDGSLYAAGHAIPANFSDSDFYLLALDPDGVFQYARSVFFDLGGDRNDQAKALVLQQIPGTSCGANCFILPHSELYLVGTAANTPYQDLANHDCAVAAFRKDLFATEFTIDTFFGPALDGRLAIDFPVGSSNEGDNDCRVAISRPGNDYQQVGQGVVIGGENYFISTLGGGTPGLASNYALAEIDPAGNVAREDAFAFFEEFSTPGIYNGILAMVREPGGRIVVTGYAGSSDPDRAPSDVGVIRFNPDYTRDTTFGNDGAGLAIVTLDGTLPTLQREWGTALAIDTQGRLLLAGNRSFNYGSSADYDWLVARLNTSDVIFRDGIDGVVY